MIRFWLKSSVLVVDLVLLRELLRNATARGPNGDANRVFQKTGLASLFECVVMRASYPYSSVAFAPRPH